METSIGKAALILAASELRESELRKLAQWINEYGASAFLDEISFIRSYVGDGSVGRAPRIYSSQGPISGGNLSDEVVSKIERLLLQEAGLSKSSAANILRERIYDELNPPRPIPDLNRNSFRTWIDKVGEVISESELLHLVTKIRNARVHNTPSDWPLSRKSEK